MIGDVVVAFACALVVVVAVLSISGQIRYWLYVNRERISVEHARFRIALLCLGAAFVVLVIFAFCTAAVRAWVTA